MSEREARNRTSRARPEADGSEEIAAEFTTEELLEFLDADRRPDRADPEFRERLREELWQLVQHNRAPRRR